MKLSLIKTQGPCPPDGFRYVDPEDGFVAHAWTYNDWVPLQQSHLSANNREVPPDLGEQMQDQLCKTLPPGWCNYDSDSRPRPTTSLGWGDVLGGLQTFAKWISGGAGYVSQEEADRRALICSRCYLNVHVEGCGACHKAVAEVTKDRKTKYDFALKACAVCKCLLKAKVHFPMETLDMNRDAVQEMYPEHCWLKKTGPNYRG
jgi:hypothetical protein